MAVPSQKPSRFVSGMSVDYPGGPTANMGLPNPHYYHIVEDDFDDSLSIANMWTKTLTGNGTAAHAAGDGGLGLLTTNSSTPLATDIASLQKPVASFSLPQGTTSGKKAFFVCRVQLADVTNPDFVAGLIQTTTTPFTVTDGLYFFKATGAANNLILRHSIGSANTDVAIPTSAYTLANATNIDLGWYINRNGEIHAFVGTQLVGWVPENQGGGLVGQRGPVAAQTTLLTAGLTTANLNPTVAVRSGTGASKTFTIDFGLWAKER